jgi:putative glutamine amidotransferase
MGKKPIIGITSHVELDYRHSLSNDYVQSVIQAGGIPIILPIGVDSDVAQLADKMDGLILVGGGDIDPMLFICRGIQILNIVIGGDMYQDIYSQKDEPLLQHSQKAARTHLSHYVIATENSLLADIAGQSRFKVNSYHHQAVRNVPKPFIVSARSSDGIIEAIESVEHSFVLGVQWHPEPLAVHGDSISKDIFNRFVQSC